jgi:hypothetical protein
VFPPEAFKKMRCKTFSLFIIYSILLLFRLAMYLNLRLANSNLNLIKTDKEIPLYISEIAMTILILILLFQTRMANAEKTIEEAKEDEAKRIRAEQKRKAKSEGSIGGSVHNLNNEIGSSGGSIKFSLRD